MKGQIDSNTPGIDDIRGARAYFQALQRDVDAHELTRSCIGRMGNVADCARRRIEADQLLREASPAVRSKFLAMTGEVSGAANGGQTPDLTVESYWSLEALEDALGQQVQVLMQDRVEFKKMFEVEIAKMSPADINRLMRVQREIVNGLAMSGIEQGECMRSARTEVQDLVTEAAGDKNPIGWLIMGWLCLWNSSSSSEACNHFAKGVALNSERTGFLAYLLYRYRAVGLDVAGKPAEAFEDAKAALALRTSADLLFEAARYAVQANRRTEARQYLEAAIEAAPITVLVAMADAEMTPLEPFIFSGYQQAEMLARASSYRAIEAWQELVNRAKASEQALGLPLELPPEICSGFSELRRHASTGDLLEALGVQSVASRSAGDLYQIATRRVNAIVESRKSDADSAEEVVDSIVKKRDSVTQRAQLQAETLITQMESELQRSMSAEDKATQGCATGLGGSFAMFMVYVVTAGFLTQRGVDTGWDSPIGMAGACLIGAPLAIGIGANLAAGIKRTAVGSEVQRRATHAREMARVTLVEVEKNCAQQAVSLRAEAAELIEQARKANEAQRILLEAPRPGANQVGAIRRAA